MGVLDDEAVSRAPVRHNATDFSAFRDAMNATHARYRRLETQRMLEERRRNLDLWDRSLPARWSKASLAAMSTSEAAHLSELVRSNPKGSIYIYGPSGAGKTYLSYAVIRRLIGLGETTPSRVCILSEDHMLGLGSTGFKGSQQFENLLSGGSNLFLLDGVGRRVTYTDKEKMLWERMLDHIYSRSLTAVFTSNVAPADFHSDMSESFAQRVDRLVEGRVVSLGPQQEGRTSRRDRFSRFSA